MFPSLEIYSMGMYTLHETEICVYTNTTNNRKSSAAIV